MKFAQETYSECLVNEMFPLWHLHAQETADANPMPLNPNLHIYRELQRNGSLRIYTMRQSGGYLVGYQVVFVMPHPHSQGIRLGQTDIVFLHPDYRKGLAALRFLKWCDNQLQCEGVHIVIKAVKARLKVGRLLERMGYLIEDVSYSRRLQEVA